MLLHPIVQILVMAMEDLATDDPSNRFRVGRVLVCRQPERLPSRVVDQAAQEAPGCLAISMLAEHGIQKIAVSVDGAVQIAPAAADFDVRFVQVPGAPRLPATSGPETITDHGRKAELPCPDCFIADLESPLEEEFSHVTKAELVAQAPEDGEQHDVGRELEIVEGRPRALIEAALAPPTGEGPKPRAVLGFLSDEAVERQCGRTWEQLLRRVCVDGNFPLP